MSISRSELLRHLVEQAREFRFCGPSDDPDRITQVTSGYMYLVVQLNRLAGPLLPEAAAERLAGIDVRIDDLYSAYEAKAEIDALLPDIEDVVEYADEAALADRLSARGKAKKVDAFSEAALQSICDVLGDTQLGLTGREIGDLLARCSIHDPNPSGAKRHRLYAALTASQRQYGCANHVVRFILEAMDPVSYAAHEPGFFEERRSRLNRVLGFTGLRLREDGKLTPVVRATTLPDPDPNEAPRPTEGAAASDVQPAPPVNFAYVERVVGSQIQQGVTAGDHRDAAEDADGMPDFTAGGTPDARATAPLTDEQASVYKRYEYQCYDRIDISGKMKKIGGKTKKGRNVVGINGSEVAIGDSLFVLLLRLVVELKREQGGYISRVDLWNEGVVANSERFHPYSNLRAAIEAHLRDRDGQKFIQNDGEKNYRVSTHPDFVSFDKEKLLKHPNATVRKLVRRLP